MSGSEYIFHILEGGIPQYRSINIPAEVNFPEPSEGGPEKWFAFLPVLKVAKGELLFSEEGFLYGQYRMNPAQLIMTDGAYFEGHRIELFVEMADTKARISDSGEGLSMTFPAMITPTSDPVITGGGGNLWIEGGDNKWSIVPKWTDRHTGEFRMIFHVGHGDEWKLHAPRSLAHPFNMTLKVEYLIFPEL